MTLEIASGSDASQVIHEVDLSLRCDGAASALCGARHRNHLDGVRGERLAHTDPAERLYVAVGPCGSINKR